VSAAPRTRFARNVDDLAGRLMVSVAVADAHES